MQDFICLKEVRYFDTMENNMSFGQQGEVAAQEYLKSNGFTILHTNWRWGHKELDIVAAKGAKLHVVEVKTRSANFLVSPQQSVDRRKQQHTVSAANAYVEKYNVNKDVQFDVISVVVKGGDCTVEYLPEAFYPTAR
ncbi:MAG: YraN family protein [Prevotellaceae bacterium]|jgi:putative endonuclease|nr:YraN family protein [Prevotellaceae bacterium]